MKTNITNEKDYSNISIEEAINWTLNNCQYNDVRKRLRSRAVAWKLLLRINALETKLAQLENK